MNPSDPSQTPAPTPPTNQPNPVSQPQQFDKGAANPLSVMEQGESQICQIRRHPIGLLGIHIMAGFMLLVSAVIIYGVLPNVLKSVATSKIIGIGTLVFVIMAALTFGFLAIAHKIYWGNRWILTSDSLTQVSQLSLFDKQSSQLSLGNLEDVTAEQNGMMSHMFNFGVLRVETAGERSKFMFPYCPNPTSYAREILQAREKFEQGRSGANEQRPYRAEDAYQTSQEANPPDFTQG
jgi:hypothetical protein